MAMDSEAVWKSEFKKLPQVSSSTSDGMKNLADFVAARVAGLAIGSPVTGTSTFTFSKASFVAPLLSLQPVTDTSGMIALANAWQTAVLASTMVTLPGAYIGAASPATTFASCVTSIFPSSVVIAYNTLLSNLLSAKPVAEDPMFPVYLRNAFAGLQYTITGPNLVVPTPVVITTTATVQ